MQAPAKDFGPQTALDDVTLAVGPRSRIGLVGPNGGGKTTLLRLLAGLEQPDAGTITRAPERLTAGYVPQERDHEPGETLLEYLARRTGVAAAEAELAAAAAALAPDVPGRRRSWRADSRVEEDKYSEALERFLTLGGGDFEPRARTVCAELGLPVELERRVTALSGGEAARVALASILLARYDLLLLDEPTNDLDFEGLERLERFLGGYPGAIVVVSHVRVLLDRVVNRIWAVEPGSHRVREWAGGFRDYAAAREAERAAEYARFEQALERRRELAALLAQRRTEARGRGGALGKQTGGADRRATHALQTKVRQAERLLERNEQPEKPFEPWELRLSLTAGERPGDLVVALRAGAAERGAFRLGPVDLDLAPGERIAVTGRNGSGKTTLLGMLLGELPLVAGERLVGRRTVIGALAQDRTALSGSQPLLDLFRSRTGLLAEPARTLLAKFGLGADHVGRSCASLSPGERTRAQLAELQVRGVNLLVLDEPTNHLDLEAVEQLEQALAGYEGTLVVVSHDRRFLESLDPSRELALQVRYNRTLLDSAAAHGRPEAEDIEGTPRQTSRAACDPGAAREHVPDVRAAQAAPPRLPHLQDVQGS